MDNRSPRMTYSGGPTALIEWRGLQLLTDPTFDPAGTVYRTVEYTLRKTQGPAVALETLGPVDAVLLSHDQHVDNLDHAGRAFLGRARHVVTTPAGAVRLGNGAVGLAPWESWDLRAANGGMLRIIATPARHGPAHADRGPVTGFLLFFLDEPENSLYISGDTVWYEGVREVGTRFPVRTALLFMGAALVRAVGDWHLTFTAAEAVEAAGVFSSATIVPLHFEGWEHLTESRADIDRAFKAAGLAHRVQWLEPGRTTEVREEKIPGIPARTG